MPRELLAKEKLIPLALFKFVGAPIFKAAFCYVDDICCCFIVVSLAFMIKLVAFNGVLLRDCVTVARFMSPP